MLRKPDSTAKNDVSFIVEDSLNLYEHQSTYNPNMPLRGLFYYASMYERYVDTHDLNIYSSKRLIIPTPQYIVFYNGNKDTPDREILKLSDLFTTPSKDGGQHEWTATMLNINLPHNAAIMEKCRPLWEYAFFVDQVKQFNREYPIEEAIDLAVKKCIETNVMANILKAHRAEVTEMLMNEYNEDKTMDLFKKEFFQEGEQKKAQSIATNLMKLGLPLSQIRQATGLSQEQVLAIKLDVDKDANYLINHQ